TSSQLISITLKLPGPHFLPLAISNTPCSVDSGRQSIAHLQSGSQQPRLYRRLADLQCCRRLRDIQVLDIAHDEDLAILRMQRSNGFLQRPPKLGSLQRFRRNLSPISKILWLVVTVLIRNSIVDGLMQKLAVLTPFHPRLVHRDLNEPGAELAFSAEGTEVPQRLEERLLGSVFSVCFILQNAERSNINRAFIGAYQLVKELLLAGADTCDKGDFHVYRPRYLVSGERC